MSNFNIRQSEPQLDNSQMFFSQLLPVVVCSVVVAAYYLVLCCQSSRGTFAHELWFDLHLHTIQSISFVVY